jgi:hypothetical protein
LWFDLNAIGSQKRAGEESKSSQWENIEQRTPINREQASNAQHPSKFPAFRCERGSGTACHKSEMCQDDSSVRSEIFVERKPTLYQALSGRHIQGADAIRIRGMSDIGGYGLEVGWLNQ